MFHPATVVFPAALAGVDGAYPQRWIGKVTVTPSMAVCCTAASMAAWWTRLAQRTLAQATAR